MKKILAIFLFNQTQAIIFVTCDRNSCGFFSIYIFWTVRKGWIKSSLFLSLLILSLRGRVNENDFFSSYFLLSWIFFSICYFVLIYWIIMRFYGKISSSTKIEWEENRCFLFEGFEWNIYKWDLYDLISADCRASRKIGQIHLYVYVWKIVNAFWKFMVNKWLSWNIFKKILLLNNVKLTYK